MTRHTTAALLTALLATTGLTAGVQLYDTGNPGFAHRSKWKKLGEDAADPRFTGDAVIVNGKLTVVVSPNASGPVVYAGSRKRAVLTPLGNGPSTISSVVIRENDAGRVALDARFQDFTVTFAVSIGQPFVETEPREPEVTALRLEAPCRFAVLPDFFADDMVIDASRLTVSAAQIPGEHFLLHLAGAGDAIVAAVSEKRADDVTMRLAGEGADRQITTSEIPYGTDGAIWVAVLEGRGIWHVHPVAGSDADTITRLNWSPPFPAQWRVDWQQVRGLTDTWEMLTPRSGGGYIKHGWFGSTTRIAPHRRRWTTVLGRFQYPCWSEPDGAAYLQPLKGFQGPAIIYPVNRIRTTPLEVYTIVDVVRGSLGLGPCEYILDVEGQRATYKGRATCATRDILNAIYTKKQQKQRRAAVEQALADVLVFVRHIRGRIIDYVAFGRDVRTYLAEQRRVHPALAESIAALEDAAAEIDRRFHKRSKKIKTPADAAGLVEKFRSTVLDYDGDDALKRCKEITRAIVEIGGNQDELVGECRMAVKILRQRAGLAMAVNPAMAPIAREIRHRTREILRHPTTYEAPRH